MSKEEKESLNWFKKHADTAIVLAAFASSMLWMNGKFNGIETRLKVIETVLIMKEIMPSHLAIQQDK